MRRRLILVVFAVVLVSCSSGKKAGGPPSTSSLLDLTTTTALPTTPVVASILSPEKSSTQGAGGRGMVVHLTFQAKDASLLPADFRLGGALPSPAPAVKPGHNPAFPGLVVTVSTTGPALGGSAANLANLFQIVSPSKQPDGSVRVSAVWTNGQEGFGSDLDVTILAFTVSGTAPDTVPQTPAELNPTSNLAQVSFHLAGGDTGSSTSSSSTTAAKATSTTKAGATTTTTKAPAAPATTTTTKATTTVPATTSTTKLLGLFPPVP
jgi:hypothetical protein